MNDKDFDSLVKSVLNHFRTAKLFHGCLVGLGFKQSSTHPELNDLYYLAVTEQVEIEVSYVTGEGRLFVGADDTFESIPVQFRDVEHLRQFLQAFQLTEQREI